MLDETVAEGQVNGAGIDLLEAVYCLAKHIGVLRQFGVLAYILLYSLSILNQ